MALLEMTREEKKALNTDEVEDELGADCLNSENGELGSGRRMGKGWAYFARLGFFRRAFWDWVEGPATDS